MVMGASHEMENLIGSISERAINALNYGNVRARVSRTVEIEPVNGIELTVNQGIGLDDETSMRLIDPDIDSTISSEMFPNPSAPDDNQSLWIRTDGTELWTPDHSQGGTTWSIPDGAGFFDPRDLEFSVTAQEGNEAKLAEIYEWLGSKLLEHPTFKIMRARNPFIDDLIAGGEGERQPTRQDEMQEISQTLTYNEDGTLTDTFIRIIMQRRAYGSRQYEFISLHPNKSPNESTRYTTRSWDVKEEPVTLRGLKRVRAAMGRFEEEFVNAA